MGGRHSNVTVKEGRKEGRKERRKEGRKEMFCLTKFSTHFIGPQFECPSALPTEIIGKLSQGTASRSTFTPGRK